MIVKQLILNNFRQFTGEHIINFSTDPEKKVTIIMAESGVGKTTLIQSFQWILYGDCKYKTILNTVAKNEMAPHSNEYIKCYIKLLHRDDEYTIGRTQRYCKVNKAINAEKSQLTIDIKKPDGTTDQKRGNEANKIIKELMNKDLFPYFFLEGESLTRVGEQMSKGKTSSNNEFIRAIKGLLGFNYLYEAKKHLNTLSKDYQSEISRNTTDSTLKTLLDKISEYEKKITNSEERMVRIKKEIAYNEIERDKLSALISEYSSLETKQKRTKEIEKLLPKQLDKINEQKRYIFKKFSGWAFYSVLEALLPVAEDTLKNSDALDKGIPGINVEAIDFILNNHKCICGKELVENSDEWETLEDWKKYLPPNNIGFEIEKFTSEIKNISRKNEDFETDFKKARSDLNDYIKGHDDLVTELETLNNDIGSFDKDVYALKEKESEYNRKIIDYNLEYRDHERKIKDAKDQIELLKVEQNRLIILNEKVIKLTKFKNECDYLHNKIDKYCDKKEAQMRIELQKAINDIFKDFYEEKIEFSLDENYCIQIKTYDAELSEDFMSGGQDVAVALAFIGAIIKLNREPDAEDDKLLGADSKEEYPLVLDAPTSNFGMKQMESFSQIMPKITDQIIVFINDKDGPILKEKMKNEIGSEWEVLKIDTYHSIINEVIKDGR